MSDKDDSAIPHCPLCDSPAVEEGWWAISRCYCENDECPIEGWDHNVEWGDSDGQ